MQSETETTTKNPSLIERLFGAGAHYGFSKSRRHPTSAPFLFGNKQGTDIFDLEKTSALLTDAAAFLREVGASGKRALFVGTKEEAKNIVKPRAESLEMPYVTNRWIGGMLTNFSEIQKRVARLATLTSQRESGELDRKYTKKERVMLAREADKLEFNFGGIREMDRMPGVIVIVDPRHESIAVKEAAHMNIPVVAIMSSDCDATQVAKPVFVNDAQIASITLALDELVAGYREGAASFTPEQKPERVTTRRFAPSTPQRHA